METQVDPFLNNNYGGRGMNVGKLPSNHYLNDVVQNLAGLELYDRNYEASAAPNEALILNTKGLIKFNVDQPGTESVEICQQTVNPDNKVGSEDFKILKTIGKGGYGTVFLVQKTTPKKVNQLFAMKVLKKARIVRSEKDTAHTVSERNILEMLRHPFLVKLHYAFQSQSYLYIVLEYCPGGELFNYLEKIVCLHEDSACFYAAEIALAIGHLHTLGIIYRDLKSENILLDRDGHVKLTDFGLSKEGVCTTNTFCGTIEYMAPEIIRCSGHGKEVDWWSLGTLLYDMLSGGPPFAVDTNKSDTAQHILYADLKFPESFSNESIAFIRGLLTRDPKKRLGSIGDVEDIKAHLFFLKHAINWKEAYERKLVPPFKPILSSETDVSMFDENFTRMQPAVSPSDNKMVVATDLFQGFSYVSSSFHEGNNLRTMDEYGVSLRSDRSKLLLNTQLILVSKATDSPSTSRLTRIAQESSDSTTSSARSEIQVSEAECGRKSVEPATDCLLMDLASVVKRNGHAPDGDDHPGARAIPAKLSNGFLVRQSLPKVSSQAQLVREEAAPVSKNSTIVESLPISTGNVSQQTKPVPSSNASGCHLM